MISTAHTGNAHKRKGAHESAPQPARARIGNPAAARLSAGFRLGRLLLAAAMIGMLPAMTSTAMAQEEVVLEVEHVQTAVLDPVQWDEVLDGELYFDAVRALLLRFPDAAETIHGKLQDGYEIEKAELVLTWADQEGPRPERGRKGWGADEQYKNNPGRWHVQAQLLRKPWNSEDKELGPTFNAYINGLGFWNQGGARADSEDRFPEVFGPEPLHHEKPEKNVEKPELESELDIAAGEDIDNAFVLDEPKKPTARLNITAALQDEKYGATIEQRLRALSDHGFQVHKQELRDMTYRNFYAYDWAVSIAYMRIWVEAPRLVVTLRRNPAAAYDQLPEAVDIAELAQTLKAEGGRGKPSMRYPEDLAQRAAAHWERPNDMPQWQWERIGELRALGQDPADSVLALGRGFNWSTLFAGDKDAYMSAMRELLTMPPRTWQGHLSSDFALLPAAYGDLLPPAVMDHLKLYWEAWLHPEVQLGMGRAGEKNLGGGSHRGGPSYFRGYSDGGGTMNFGHNAVMGAMLGAQVIDADYPLAEAQSGLNRLLVGNFGLNTGAHQEIGDTYYQALTLGSPAAIHHFAEVPADQLKARIHLDRLLESLISMYHPGTRRLTHPMGRGHYEYHFLLQEGPYHALHTLSRRGTLIHLDDLKNERKGTPKNWGSVHGLNILGDEAPPNRIAVLSPWVEPFLAEPIADLLDEKVYPWTVHARDFSPGCRPGGWHVNYLSSHYALASRDNANYNYGVTSVIGQWRRGTDQVNHLDDTGHLLLDFSSNDTFTRSGLSMGEFGIVQHENKMIAMKSLPSAERITQNAGKETVRSLHTSALIMTFGDTSKREIWINDSRAEKLSGARPAPNDKWQDRVQSSGARVRARDGDVITINDGATYIGLIPITANAMHREREVEISYEHPITLIHSYIYDADGGAGEEEVAAPEIRNGLEERQDTIPDLDLAPDKKKTAAPPLDLDKLHEQEAPPTAGFVLEMGDASQYASFEAFREHMNTVALETSWNEAEKFLEVHYKSADDLLEMSYDPLTYPARNRAVNGHWPYLGEGILRESSWAVQGRAEALTKNGARLVTAPGKHGYLLASPVSDLYIGYNPIPEHQPWELSLPDDLQIKANGEIGMLRVVVRPTENKIWVDHVATTEPHEEDMADGLELYGFSRQPVVEINGKVVQPERKTIAGVECFFIPLQP